MRTKTTLAAAAILAAGLASSMAQNVYSLKVVGYTVNTIGPKTAFCNSLRAAAGTPEQDRLDKVIPATPANEGDSVLIWNGASWDSWTLDSLSPSGWVNPAGNNAPANTLPVLGPGVGFIYANNVGPSAVSITFVGEVRTGTTVVPLPSGLTPTGSPLPYGGLASTGPINLQVPDGDSILKFNGISWDTYTADSLAVGGWTVPPSGNDGPEPTLLVGEGFFYANNSAPPVTKNWTQTLTIP
jgi:hypothetical protein